MSTIESTSHLTTDSIAERLRVSGWPTSRRQISSSRTNSTPPTTSSQSVLNDRNTLFTTPHILCTLATHEILPVEYVEAALTYHVETKG